MPTNSDTQEIKLVHTQAEQNALQKRKLEVARLQGAVRITREVVTPESHEALVELALDTSDVVDSVLTACVDMEANIETLADGVNGVNDRLDAVMDKDKSVTLWGIPIPVRYFVALALAAMFFVASVVKDAIRTGQVEELRGLVSVALGDGPEKPGG